MASIIKNQLVKHLSKFTRNLKPEQISLDVLKGKSKLQYIQINEEVLTEILELPPWLRIKSAHCTGVTVSVPWTKLKSSPVQIFIDEINVEVVLTTDAPESKKGPNAPSAFTDNNSYGFVDKVVEGMSLYINTVEINFDSEAFGGSFMLSRLSVESRTPGWSQAQDLRQTRISCSTVNRTLMFKQISWHLLRVEASAKTERTEKRSTINAPLRLITSGGKIRIALKKHSGDGSVVNARIQMLLEDILWVATVPQLRSALAFYSYIMTLVRKTAETAPPVIIPHVSSKPSNMSNSESYANLATSTFRAFDFDQTSHHLHVRKIDLHLCDDANSQSGYPPGWDIDSGAMQVTLMMVLIDIYPRTLSTSDRSHWVRYQAPNAFTQWIESRLAVQLESLSSELDETGKIRLSRCWPQLMSFNVVVRVYDLSIQCVSEQTTKKDRLQNMFASERHARTLPADQFIVHFEFANFFHPMSDTLPVPAPASYLQLGPFSLLFDERTLRWALYVVHNLSTAIDPSEFENMEPLPHSDIKIDLLMPKLILNLPDPSSDRRLPHRLLVSFSTISLCNCPFHRDARKLKGITKNIMNYLKDVKTLGGIELYSFDAVQFNEAAFVRGAMEQFWIQTSPAWVETDHGANTSTLPVISDVSFAGTMTIRPEQVNVYVEPTSVINAIIDHFQFLQLTRLGVKIGEMTDMLAADQVHYSKGVESPTPIVAVLAVLQEVRAHVLLTMGPMPSPYDKCPAVTENLFLDTMSEAGGTSRANTPRRDIPVVNEVKSRSITVKKATTVEEFPEFPIPGNIQEFDASSYVDDTMSVATSIEDESYEFEMAAEDDLFPTADLAEEAGTIDEIALNDRIYKSLMAQNGNVLNAVLHNVVALVNVKDKNTRVTGQVNKVNLSYDLNVLRQSTYDTLKKRREPTNVLADGSPEVEFKVDVPSSSSTTFVEANVKNLKAKLDDEIVAHLSPFAQDEQFAENKVRLKVVVQQSNIEIIDRKKKKPLRIRVKDCVIEQDEDARTDVEEE